MIEPISLPHLAFDNRMSGRFSDTDAEELIKIIELALITVGMPSSVRSEVTRTRISSDRDNLRNCKSMMGIPSAVEHDERLGVPRGILWGLCISLPLWALFGWMVSLA